MCVCVCESAETNAVCQLVLLAADVIDVDGNAQMTERSRVKDNAAADWLVVLTDER